MEQNDNAMGFKEAKFDINELFFSITSHDSTILSGNDVFVRISGYQKDELIGSFHNIIRHPDMPRVVFKMFWEYLKTDKPIVAYVKNKTKEGGYYWVLAAVFPLKERYVSIRIKPTTRLFSVIQELYPLLLDAERHGGVEESGAMIPVLLHNLGYSSYSEFMSDALLHELQERQKLLSTKFPLKRGVADSPYAQRLQTVQYHAQTLMEVYDAWFSKINTFLEIKSTFEGKSLILRQVAQEVVILSLNASVASYKVENGGETFGILARDVRTNAKENDALIERIDILVHSLSGSLNDLIFSVSGIRLQTEIVSYFIGELLCGNSNTQHDEIEANMDTLVRLVTEYSEKTDTLQSQIDQQLQETLKYLNQLERQMMYLGYIQVYGIIEAAGNTHQTVNFEGIFSQLKTLIQKTSLELEVMQKMGENFYTSNRLLMDQSYGMDRVLKALNEEMFY